ncbi:MAG: proteasome accessory factor PafA2 family protein [Opitutales bacterium]
MQRITGLETEYGCLIDESLKPREILIAIRDWIFKDDRYGLIDVHDRDWDEPAGNGGFLFNGGRVYIDMGHIEYCTPECLSASDVVRYDRAGDAILRDAVHKLGLDGKVSFVRNNIDHCSGSTFGCHENYSMSRLAPFSEKNVHSLLSFLTLRILYTGSGRVGAAVELFLPELSLMKANSVPFQITQRSDYIQNDFYEWVQHNRAILNTRDEPLADPTLYRRLHLLHGDTNVYPATLFLKVGTTRLVLDLLEENALPDVVLDDAVGTLRSLSRQLNPPWLVRGIENQRWNALKLLHEFHRRAQQLFFGRDEETNQILSLWGFVLEKLESDKSALIGLVDWVGKEHLLENFRASENLEWDHPWLQAQDLEFHQIDPERSLGLALSDTDGFWQPERVRAATIQPPVNSRAAARSRRMREIQKKNVPYVVEWERISVPKEKPIYFMNPFQP